MAVVSIVSRYPSVQFGLRAMLDAVSGLTLADDGVAADRSFSNVDVVLIDYDGEPLDQFIDRASQEGIALVVLGAPREILQDLLLAQLRGFASISRESSGEEISAAIEAASQGLVVLEPRDAMRLATPVSNRPELPPLTQRERQILQLISEGLANKEIAKKLNISVHTVKFHVAATLEKLGAASRTEAVSIGIREGAVHV